MYMHKMLWRSRRKNTQACERKLGRLCLRGDLSVHTWKMSRSFPGRGGRNSRNREQTGCVQRQWGTAELLCLGSFKWFNISDKYIFYSYWSIKHEGARVKGWGRRDKKGLHYQVFHLKRFWFSYEKPLKP